VESQGFRKNFQGMPVVCVCVYVSFKSIGCMYHEYDRWTGTWISNGDIAVFSRIWTCSGLIRGDPKFGQGLGYIAALQVKGLRVYGVSVTFMSTGYMYHRYDLRTGDWMMILISTGDVTVSSPF